MKHLINGHHHATYPESDLTGHILCLINEVKAQAKVTHVVCAQLGTPLVLDRNGVTKGLASSNGGTCSITKVTIISENLLVTVA